MPTATAQRLPTATREYARVQRREKLAALSALRRLWRRMGRGDLDIAWSQIDQQALSIMLTAQQRIADAAVRYVPDVLEDLGQQAAAAPVASVTTGPLLGVAGDGRPVDSLLHGAVVHTRTRLGDGLTPGAALVSGSKWLTLAAGTVLSDTSRQSEKLAMGVRPRVRFYVRMLAPPSCARCVILAGSTYRSRTAFQRHPRCDCVHIPSAEALDDRTVNPREYIDSLSPDEQDRILTKAGGRAYREGADLNQLVNARRGMSKSQSGRLITSEGRTSRGCAFRSLRAGGTRQELAGTAVRITRNGPEMRVITRTGARVERLMPESIAELAGADRDLYLRLLRRHGYLI